jgi:hypothetical protein
MVGVLENPKEYVTILQNEGDLISLLGPLPTNANSSVYVREILGERFTLVLNLILI